MNKFLWILTGAGLIFGLTMSGQVYAIGDETPASDRDLNVTSDVNNDSHQKEVGEVEKDTDRGMSADGEGHDALHEERDLHEDHESMGGESHESEISESHDHDMAGEAADTHMEMEKEKGK
ncbi:MAG: hypothetical protein ACYDBV_00005 [Nitrospiria bacterium]